MFEAIGALTRLPVGILWIGAVIIGWPLWVLVSLGFILVNILLAPAIFIGAAFGGDKEEWNHFVKDKLSEPAKGMQFPSPLVQKILKWIETGEQD